MGYVTMTSCLTFGSALVTLRARHPTTPTATEHGSSPSRNNDADDTELRASLGPSPGQIRTMGSVRIDLRDLELAVASPVLLPVRPPAVLRHFVSANRDD